MRSKVSLALAAVSVTALAAFGLGACGAGKYDHTTDGKGLIGRKPSAYSTAYLWQNGDTNAVAAIDRGGMTLQQFNLEPFTHVRSLPLPLGDAKQGIVASADGRYYVTLGADQYAVLKANGAVEKNPVELLGAIQSVAFDPADDILVLVDEFQTMALLALSPDGDVVASRKVGSRLPDGRSVVAGAMLGGGRLVLSLDDKSMIVADVPGTIASPDKWAILSDFPVPAATDLGWIAPIPGLPNAVLVLDGSRVLTVDVIAKAILDQKDLSATTIRGYYRDYVPHVIAQSLAQSAATESDVIYAGPDGKLVTSNIRGSANRVIQTWLDPATGGLTVSFDAVQDYTSYRASDDDDAYRPQVIFRFRLADNQAVDKTEILDGANLVVTPSCVFLLFQSALGKAERRGYGKTPNTVRLEGYDLDLARKRYKN